MDDVKVGASLRLHSIPMRRPRLKSNRSSSAPWCVAQKYAWSGRIALIISSTA